MSRWLFLNDMLSLKIKMRLTNARNDQHTRFDDLLLIKTLGIPAMVQKYKIYKIYIV